MDRRAATNVPNIFFKLKKLQMKQGLRKTTLAVQQFKTKGKKLKVKDILDNSQRCQLVNVDEGFLIFQTICNSPAYLEKGKKDAFVMIRQLGFPSIFISQSAPETKWIELLQTLGQLLDNVTFTSEGISEMNGNTIFRLVKSYPVTVICYFDHRFQQLLHHQVVKSPHSPIHEVIDYFTRIEFASRGSIQVHWFAYLKDAPKYGEDSNEVIAEYFDQIISCSSNVPPEFICFLECQLHRFMKFCRIGNKPKCKHGFPKPPMCKTMIFEGVWYGT